MPMAPASDASLGELQLQFPFFFAYWFRVIVQTILKLFSRLFKKNGCLCRSIGVAGFKRRLARQSDWSLGFDSPTVRWESAVDNLPQYGMGRNSGA
jgi:hypothetical protein